MKNAGGAISLPASPQLALTELEKLRADGIARTSDRTPQLQPVNGLVPFRTDAYVLPHWSITCMLWQLFALLACSAAQLGVAKDPIVRLNPKKMSFNGLANIGTRNPLAPIGALVLVRLCIGQWEVIRRRAGLFIFNGWLRRGGLSLSHALGYNAGVHAAGLRSNSGVAPMGRATLAHCPVYPACVGTGWHSLPRSVGGGRRGV